MEFIIKQSKIFNNLVHDHFAKKYNRIFKSRNVLIIKNKNLNHHYNSNLDETKSSLVYIMYKNIYYRKIHQTPISYLDSLSKKKINQLYNHYNKNYMLSDNIIVLGKRYIDKKTNHKINNSLQFLCFFPIKNNKETETETETVVYENEKKPINSNSVNRRCFLFNLKNLITESKTTFKSAIPNFYNNKFNDNIYINNLIKNGLFFDVEYTNDIYDDFKSFPESKDNSMLFMIGVSFLKNNPENLEYNHFTVDKLTSEFEYKILYNFLDFIQNKYKNQKSNYIYLFHWSHADKTCLEKCLKKYPDLYNVYLFLPIIYIDLLQVVKKTVYSNSYSLKYIAKDLLNFEYDTDCKNGLDAMISIIQKNNQIIDNQKLIDYDITKDVIEYNKLDTILLYKVLKHFTKT